MKLSLSRKCIHFPIHPLKSKKYCILFLVFSYFSGIGAGFLKEQIFAFLMSQLRLALSSQPELRDFYSPDDFLCPS